MALTVHIIIALVVYRLCNHSFRSYYDRFMGTPLTAGQWVGVYLKALLVLVVVPYVIAEAGIMAFSDAGHWNYSRFIVLLPHLGQVVIERRINRLLRRYFRPGAPHDGRA